MKKKLFLLPFLAFGLMFTACDPDNNNDNNPSSGNGQPMVLNLDFNQIDGWLGQTYEYVAGQLTQMGFTLSEDDDDYKDGHDYLYEKVNYTTMSGYMCDFYVNDNGIVTEVQMVYEAMNATFSNTVANFKKYSGLQNQTYADRQTLRNMGFVDYGDSMEEEFTENNYDSYEALVSALDNLPQHNFCNMVWAVWYGNGFGAETMAGYQNMGSEGQAMYIGILVALTDSGDDR